MPGSPELTHEQETALTETREESDTAAKQEANVRNREAIEWNRGAKQKAKALQRELSRGAYDAAIAKGISDLRGSIRQPESGMSVLHQEAASKDRAMEHEKNEAVRRAEEEKAAENRRIAEANDRAEQELVRQRKEPARQKAIMELRAEYMRLAEEQAAVEEQKRPKGRMRAFIDRIRGEKKLTGMDVMHEAANVIDMKRDEERSEEADEREYRERQRVRGERERARLQKLEELKERAKDLGIEKSEYEAQFERNKS
ncbi:hypothetical protein HY624_01970 [Candidatus Uhrbacteria bacterium]|nr:hypothetical protein [Candidatus Uhrbacteria bacterium]